MPPKPPKPPSKLRKGTQIVITKGVYKRYLATVIDETPTHYVVLTHANQAKTWKHIPKDNVMILRRK